jgi:N-acetylmuramoyl-L-alanine amidase
VSGLREKDITLRFAQAAAAALRAAGLDVVLSRSDDRFLPLEARVAMAQAADAALMLSLHADTVSVGDASGASVYRRSDAASDALAAELAVQANAGHAARAALHGVPADLRPALGSMMLRTTEQRTDLLAGLVVEALGERVPLLAGRPLRSAGFVVLGAPDIPSVLIELGFMSNAEDRARFADPGWQAAAVAALVTAVQRWFSVTQGMACAEQACQTPR